MILDQGTGAHSNQTQYGWLGWAWSWVSGESAVVVADADYTLTLAIDRSHSLELAVDRSHSLNLAISRSLSLTLTK